METLDLNNQRNPRPTGLKVLCILSWIYIGFSLISSAIGLMSGKADEEEMLQMKVEMTKSISQMKDMGMTSFAEMMNKIQMMAEITNENQLAIGLTGLAILILGLYGVIAMWQGKKIGFHLYVIYSILAIVQIYFFVSPSIVPTFIVVWNVLFSGLFILLYSKHLKWML